MSQVQAHYVAGPGTLCRRPRHITSQVQTQYVAGLQNNADLRHFLSPAADLRRGSAKKHRPATGKHVTRDVLPRHLRRNGPAAQQQPCGTGVSGGNNGIEDNAEGNWRHAGALGDEGNAHHPGIGNGHKAKESQ